MILALSFLTACSTPCEERAGVYSLLDDNGLNWNLRLAPDSYQYFGGSYMEYTLAVQVPAQDNARTYLTADRFTREMCREERLSITGTAGRSDVDGVGLSGDVEGELDREGHLFLSYDLLLTTPEGQEPLAAEVTVPRESSVEDWVGETGDTWF